MVYIKDPDSEGGGGGGTGGGVPPVGPWVRLSPEDTTVSVGGTPVTLITSWGNLASNPTLSPGSFTLTNGGTVIVSPAATTTYTLSDGAGHTSTATVTVGQPSSSVLRYPKVQWVFTEPYPLGSVIGFDVLFFIGADPTDTTSWVMLPIRCEAADRELIYPVRLVPPVQLSVAVRAVYEYANRTSDWFTIGAPVTFQ